LKQSEVVAGILVVSDEEGPAFREPCERPLDNPTPSGVPFLSLVIKLFLSDLPEVYHISRFLGRPAPGRIIIALIETQVLGAGFCQLRAVHHDGFQGRLQEFAVVDVRSRNG
jgi:hypothetical protein